MPKEQPRSVAAAAAVPREANTEARNRMDVDGAGPSALEGVQPMPLFPPVSAADLLGGKVEWRKVCATACSQALEHVFGAQALTACALSL
jgi:hypothetical protein